MMKKPIYLDNAATTPLDPKVLEAMQPFLLEQYGNPSSIHQIGRTVKVAIEKARRKIADILGASPSEIFFTSGGTEGDNAILCGAIEKKAIKTAITSRAEHHAVLHALEYLERQGKINLLFVDLDEKGTPSKESLCKLLKDNQNSIVSLMHGNNEIGNLIDLNDFGEICMEYNAFFHSDTVQTMGHLEHNLQNLKVDGLVGSAHKLHGPKGIGFMYLGQNAEVPPFVHGGSQERNMRGGTENVAGIIGLAEALSLTSANRKKERDYVYSLKDSMITGLNKEIKGIGFNGETARERSLDHVLNVSFPCHIDKEMLLFNLDILGICASGGSACTSGSTKGSHVLEAIRAPKDRAAVRFSFCKYNTKEEVDFVVRQLVKISNS